MAQTPLLKELFSKWSYAEHAERLFVWYSDES